MTISRLSAIDLNRPTNLLPKQHTMKGTNKSSASVTTKLGDMTGNENTTPADGTVKAGDGVKARGLATRHHATNTKESGRPSSKQPKGCITPNIPSQGESGESGNRAAAKFIS